MPDKYVLPKEYNVCMSTWQRGPCNDKVFKTKGITAAYHEHKNPDLSNVKYFSKGSFGSPHITHWMGITENIGTTYAYIWYTTVYVL